MQIKSEVKERLSQIRIIAPYGDNFSVREFVEWEYNGGKEDFEPDMHCKSWNTLPIDGKLGHIACSLFGDLASFGSYSCRIGVSDGHSTYYFFFTQEGKDEEILLSLAAFVNVIYTSAEDTCKQGTGLTFADLPLAQRLDVIAKYIENNFEACVAMLANVPYMQWT